MHPPAGRLQAAESPGRGLTGWERSGQGSGLFGNVGSVRQRLSQLARDEDPFPSLTRCASTITQFARSGAARPVSTR